MFVIMALERETFDETMYKITRSHSSTLIPKHGIFLYVFNANSKNFH